MINRRHCLATLGALAGAHALPSWAQADFPNKPIRMLVPFSAGGSPDLMARVISVQLGKQLGQSVVVDNRVGANGIIAGEAVARAEPDGHTLLVTTGSHAINPSIYRKLPYDTIADFAPVSLFNVAPALTLVVNNNSPAKTFKDFLELARKPDGNVSFGSPGTGNTLHLAGELLNVSAGTRMLHVPYKGAAPALNAVMAGEVTACYLSMTAAIIAVKGGQVRPLAVTSAQRVPAFPDVPTMAESGVAGMDYNGGWVGVFAPGKTPRPVIQKLSAEINKAMQAPDVKEKLLSWDAPPASYTPEEFARFFQSEMDKFSRIVKVANVPMQ
ncbi:MAG: tripartite tricarboxylate transporter substrate binding protein [Burkholderiaceae bacterium]|nr:tripartite tricarboxylate transporter substrate binding protein [Burkholderiaceae bacterium]